MKTLISIATIIIMSTALSGCVTTQGNVVPSVITKDVNHVIVPPATLFNCPQITTLPNPATLTNKDLATLITNLMKDNRTCGYNMAAIQSYIKKAKAAVKAENSATKN